MTIQKIKSGRVPGQAAETYVGSNGQLFYNEASGELRVSDGITPGGRIVSGGGGGTATYPSQTNHAGEFLQTNGTTVLWATVPAGATGPKGDTGATGPKGDTGERGLQGIKGDTGATGATGAKGNTGATGATGPAGAQGLKGDTGAQGPQGETGATGAQGVSVTLQGTLALIADLSTVSNPQPGDAWIVTEGGGDLYFRTVAGTWDNIGQIVGPQGDQGVQGEKGDKGDTGSTGPAGAKGDTGATGATGPQGAKGDKGDTGETGPQGDTGATGATGDQGPTGATGDQGPIGDKGDQGFSAYEVAINSGSFGGTEAEWLASLVGAPGTNGADALWNWQGAYDNGAMYAEGDIVEFNGSTYRRNNYGNSVTGYNPEQAVPTAFWEYLALKGQDGAKGDTGETGAKGDTGGTGAKGDKGDTGETGLQGERGETGPKGDPGTAMYLGDTAPTDGTQFWFNTVDNRLYVDDDGVWVDASPQVPQYIPTDISELSDDTGLLGHGGVTSYNDLTDKPILFSGDYYDLTSLPTLFSGSYTDLTDKPTIPAAQVQVDWRITDPSNIAFIQHKPTLFSGSWNDLTDVPDILTISDTAPNSPFWFNTDDGRLYVDDNGTWVDANPQITPETFSGDYNDLTNQPNIFSGDYDDLANKPTIPSVTADLTPTDVYWDSTDGRAYVKYNDQWVDIAPTIPVQVPTDISELTDDDGLLNNTGGVTDYNDLDNLPSLFSGDYEDLTNTPSIPTDLNQLNNSSGFITGNGPSISNPTISFDSGFPLGAPSLNTSSTGTRFKLWPQVSSVDTDYAIGMDSSTMWFGIPNSGTAFKWYSGTTKILQLQGNGSLTFADNTTQTTAWTGSVAYSSVTGKPTFATVATSGSYADLTDKPNLAATYSFNVAADDSTLREISAEETVKFIGAGGITTSSDDEGAITITQGSTDTVIKVAGSFASDQSFKSEVIADLTDGVSISTWMGLPAFATNKTWKFGYNGNLTFPDTTVQTTAWTGSVAYASVTGTPTLATVATSGSYADLSSKPTIYTSAYIGTTSLAFNRSSASQTLNGVSIDGSAATLTTARNINGVSFDGSANINVPRITDGTNTLKIVPAPSTLAGASGDLKGNIAFTDTYLYYCKTAYGGTSYVATASSGQTAAYVVVRKSVAYTPAAGWTITFGTPLTISSVVDAGVVFGYDSWRLNLSTSVSSTGGSDYVLTDTSNTIWAKTPWNAITDSVTTLSSLTSVGTLAGLRTTGLNNFGSNTFTKAGYDTGDITLDNGSTDTPGLLMYYANNNNFAIDSWNGTFSILSGQLLRVVNNLNESGGAVKMAMDTTGNIVTTGFIQPSAWRAGQVIRDTMLNNSEFTVNNTTVATSTTDTTLLTYSYTPTSSSSYLIIHVHVADYRAASDTGGAGTDSYFSRIKVDDAEIVYSRQMTRSGEGFRTGSLFPLTGRYTNSSTTAKTITVAVRRDSADDSITVTSSATALTLRITEIAR